VSSPASRRSRVRALRGGAVVLAAGLLASGLAACSSSGGSDASSDSGSSAGSFATVATKFGKVTVPKKPVRVVALGWGDAETALALGVQPVGASDWLAFGGDGVGPWAKGKYTSKPEIIGTMQPEYEKIAALKPDLILDTKSSGDSARYSTLSKIAPTLDVPKGGDQYKTSWQQQTEMIATALGEKAKGDQLIAGVNRKFAAAAKAHPEFKGKTVTVGALSGAGYGAYVQGDSRIDFMQRLGFRNNPKVQAKAGAGYSINVSRENLDLLDSDLVVMSPIATSPSRITGDKLYQDIPAVTAGHDVVLGDQDVNQAFATDSVLSLGYALDKVVPQLGSALAK
jgi:iron complex transport system substrate-binding protein